MNQHHFDPEYKARIYHDKAVTEQIEKDLLVMVKALIGTQQLSITECHGQDKFDPATSCKIPMRERYCGLNGKKYVCHYGSNGCIAFGNSIIEIYCHIIASIAGNKVFLPFSVLPDRKEEEKEEKEEE